MTEVQELAQIYSDLYKDVHGFRPSFSEEVLSTEVLRGKIAALSIMAMEQDEEESKIQKANVRKLKEMMTEHFYGGNTVEDFVQKLDEKFIAHGDLEYIDYKMGVPFGTIEKMLKGIEV